MKPCLFCGALENSDEHIISHSVWKRLDGGDKELEAGEWNGVAVKQVRKAHRQESYVTRAVCECCNRGWMSDLETAFLDVAGPLIEPAWPCPDGTHIARAMNLGDVIARWAVKTAVTSNAAGVVQRAINKIVPANLHAGKLPPNQFFVLIGHIRESAISIQVNQGFHFEENASLTWKGPENNAAFDAIFQLRHLAIRAVHHPSVSLRYPNSTASMPLQCYPPARSGITPSDYTFETLDNFVGRLIASGAKPQMAAAPL